MAFISVANGGPPIAEADVETIFEAFRRLHPCDDNNGPHPHGVGLGLSIVRSVVAAHGGKVTAPSGDGRWP
jgi:signal transduction histidine kinase